MLSLSVIVRPVAAVAVDQPAVELHVARLLPRVATPRREAAVHAALDLGGGVLVLSHEHLHAGVAHLEQVVEHRVLERARVEQVADLESMVSAVFGRTMKKNA